LHLRGAQVIVYDPQAGETARTLYPTLAFATSTAEAVADSDAVLLLTEWDDFTGLDPVVLAAQVRNPVMIDARNVLDRQAWRAAGWSIRTLGTPELLPTSPARIESTFAASVHRAAH
jgi:UDPglucose 6-dehydrogenase